MNMCKDEPYYDFISGVTCTILLSNIHPLAKGLAAKQMCKMIVSTWK